MENSILKILAQRIPHPNDLARVRAVFKLDEMA